MTCIGLHFYHIPDSVSRVTGVENTRVQLRNTQKCCVTKKAWKSHLYATDVMLSYKNTIGIVTKENSTGQVVSLLCV